jgi:hypothetical protein
LCYRETQLVFPDRICRDPERVRLTNPATIDGNPVENDPIR